MPLMHGHYQLHLGRGSIGLEYARHSSVIYLGTDQSLAQSIRVWPPKTGIIQVRFSLTSKCSSYAFLCSSSNNRKYVHTDEF